MSYPQKIPAQRHGRILHVGPYGDEARSFKTMEPVLAANGLTLACSHLGIYLSDPRRTAPEKLRTVLLRELA